MKNIKFILLLLLSIPAGAQVTEIPFKIEDNGHIYLSVKINHTENELYFVFDTGATSDLINESVAIKLGLKADYHQNIQGAGGSKSYGVIKNQITSISDKITFKTNFVISDLSRLNDAAQTPIDGIIGYSLLKNNITEIDYENKVLRLYKSINNIDKTKYTQIPFSFNNGIAIPQFDIKIQLNNNEILEGRILFDSGAGLTLVINTPFNTLHHISEKSGKTIISKTENLSTKSISETVSIKALQIGDYTFKDLPILIAYDKQGVSAYKGYLGILGAGIIKRFNLILDYKTKTLYLKPNINYKNKFNFPVSGLKIKKHKKDILIEQVEETSSAFKKGIREGDKIIAINGNTSYDLKTYRDFLKQESKTVVLKLLKPSGDIVTLSLKLERLL